MSRQLGHEMWDELDRDHALFWPTTRLLVRTLKESMFLILTGTGPVCVLHCAPGWDLRDSGLSPSGPPRNQSECDARTALRVKAINRQKGRLFPK
jgi:hypothetical protein